MKLDYPNLGYEEAGLFPIEDRVDLPRRARPSYARPSSTYLPGSWRYRAPGRRNRLLWGATVISASLHAWALIGFNQKAPPPPVVVDEPMTVTLLTPPKPIDDPDDTLPDLGDKADTTEGVDVPRLADVPAAVVLSTDFVQRFDYSSLIPNTNLQGTKLFTIPTNIRPGGGGGLGNLKDIFNLADLDRAPVAIFQPVPAVPFTLKQHATVVNLVVEFIVNARGEVVYPRIIKSSDSTFEPMALRGVEKWKFRPGIKRGRPVNTRMIQPMTITVMSDDR